jgi:hypothetical protein
MIDGILARIHAVCHKILHPTHKLLWKNSPILNDPEFKCAGDIVCETCDIIFWCRFYDHKNSPYSSKSWTKYHKDENDSRI